MDREMERILIRWDNIIKLARYVRKRGRKGKVERSDFQLAKFNVARFSP